MAEAWYPPLPEYTSVGDGTLTLLGCSQQAIGDERASPTAGSDPHCPRRVTTVRDRALVLGHSKHSRAEAAPGRVPSSARKSAEHARTEDGPSTRQDAEHGPRTGRARARTPSTGRARAEHGPSTGQDAEHAPSTRRARARMPSTGRARMER